MCEDSELTFLGVLQIQHSCCFECTQCFNIFWPWGNDLLVINRITDLQGQVIHPPNHCRIILAFSLKDGLSPELEEVSLLFTWSPTPRTCYNKRILSCSVLPVLGIEAFLILTSLADIKTKKQSVPTMKGKLATLGLLRSDVWLPM